MGEAGSQYDDEWEDDTSAEFFDGVSTTTQSNGIVVEAGVKDSEPSHMAFYAENSRDVSGEETVGLVKSAVETARKALQSSLANSDLSEDAVEQTNLMIQLNSQGLRDFPEKAIELLKPDVEQLVIANNSIRLVPYKFGELQTLTYLNIQGNRLKEFPKAFLKLSKLQVLDVGRNQLGQIPDEIKQMKALRVLSASSNNLESLPHSLGFLDSLRILKIDGNPLNDHYKRLVEESGGFPRGDYQPMTTKLKELLRLEVSSVESTGDSSESPLETPKPLRRNNSLLRFPVAVPGLSGSESTPDLTSPSSLRSKSHTRVTSGASSTYSASRRPGVTPLLINNDRIRSNSEGMTQSTPGLRTKRVGTLSKRTPELPSDSMANNRNSLHLRGVSHGTGIKDRNPSARSFGRSHLLNGSPASDFDRGHEVVRRLSSLREADNTDLPGFAASEVQACKGLLYSLHQMHVLIGNHYNIVQSGTPRRSSLERVYYNATTHLDNLGNSLSNMYSAVEEEDNIREDACRNTREGSRSCVVAYKQVIELVQRGTDSYISDTDPRFVRTFLHLLYASVIEAVNATANLRAMLDEGQTSVTSKVTVPPSNKQQRPKLSVRSVTPIKERPRITTRVRSEITSSNHRPATSRYKPSPHPYSAVPSHLGRSRSNSRTMTGVITPANSSLTGTPRSGDSLYIPHTPGLPTPARDYNPMSGADFGSQDIVFEQVHFAFVQAVNLAGPSLKEIFARFRNQQKVLIEAQSPRSIQEYMARLCSRAKHCQDRCDALKTRLAGVKLKDPEVRHSFEFWSCCTRFVNAFIRLIDEVKAAKRFVVIDSDIMRLLKPIHLAIKAAINALSGSPWASHLQSPNPPPSQAQSRVSSKAGSPAHSRAQSKDTPPSSLHNVQYISGTAANMPPERMRTANIMTNNVSGASLSARTRGDSETSISPYLPQTPLSAALGPAAQATIPATLASAVQPGTPPKTSFDTSFKGDVFERADNLLRSQSVLGHRR